MVTLVKVRMPGLVDMRVLPLSDLLGRMETTS